MSGRGSHIDDLFTPARISNEDDQLATMTAYFGTVLNAANWSLTALAALFLSLRVYCKISRSRGLWWDDYILIAAFVSRRTYLSVARASRLILSCYETGHSARRCGLHHEQHHARVCQPRRSPRSSSCKTIANPRRCSKCLVISSKRFQQDLIWIYAYSSNRRADKKARRSSDHSVEYHLLLHHHFHIL